MERFCGFCKGFAPDKADLLLIPMQKEQRWSFYLSNLEKFQQVSAVFAVSDYYAIDLMRFLIEQDFSVPEYLMLVSGTFVPMAGATLLSTLFRCLEKPRLPLYASILSALLNTGLNYILIFGKLGITPMGVRGADCLKQQV